MKWIKTLFGQSAEKQFLKAAESGDADKVTRLIKDGVDKEAKNEEGLTAIHLASQKGHGTIIESLLAAGAEKNAKDNDGLGPLHWAAFKGHCDAVKILLAACADKDGRDNEGKTLLHWAALGGHHETVGLLLASGVTRESTRDNWTPLHFAAMVGSVPVVECLLAEGVDKEAKTSNGLTAEEIARRKGQADVVLRFQLEPGSPGWGLLSKWSGSLEKLLYDLECENAKTKAEATMAITHLGDWAVEPLLTVFNKEHLVIGTAEGKAVFIKGAAATALGILGSQEAVNPLCALAKWEPGDKLSYLLFDRIVTALRSLMDVGASGGLIHALDQAFAVAPTVDDSNWWLDPTASSIREPLAKALAALPNPGAVVVLEKALSDYSFSVAQAAIKALIALGEPGINVLFKHIGEQPDAKHRYDVERALDKLDYLSDAQIDYLCSLVKSDSCADIVKRNIVGYLGDKGRGRTTGFLIALLTDGQSGLRVNIPYALGRSNDLQALQPLIAALSDIDPKVRAACCSALGKLADSRAIEPLASALDDADSDVRKAAAFALAEFGDARALAHITSILAQTSEPYVALSAAQALVKFKNPHITELVVSKLSRHIEQATDEYKAASLVDGLLDFRTPQVTEIVFKLLSSPKQHARQHAIKTLCKINEPSAADRIAECLEDSEKDVRLVAAEALAKLGDNRGFELLYETLITDTLDHRLLPAINGFGFMPHHQAVAPLVLRLRGAIGEVRTAIISALAKHRDLARQALQPMLNDSRPLLRQTAQLVLDQMAANPPNPSTGKQPL